MEDLLVELGGQGVSSLAFLSVICLVSSLKEVHQSWPDRVKGGGAGPNGSSETPEKLQVTDRDRKSREEHIPDPENQAWSQLLTSQTEKPALLSLKGNFIIYWGDRTGDKEWEGPYLQHRGPTHLDPSPQTEGVRNVPRVRPISLSLPDL